MDTRTGRLCFGLYDELYVVDLGQVMYFQADDHYSHVYYASGTHFMLPFGLSKVESAIGEQPEGSEAFVRLGRKHIVNTRRIFHVSTIKQQLLLADDSGGTVAVKIPKHVLRTLIDNMRPQ